MDAGVALSPARRRLLLSLAVGVAAFAPAACGDTSGPFGPLVEGVDLDALFAPPGTAERSAVAQEWAARQPAASDVREELRHETVLASEPATLLVLSHVVDGHRHAGLVLTADDAPPASLPILVYAHGGDGGVDFGELQTLAQLLEDDASAFAFVAPAFRSEPARAGGVTFSSEGPASPWDRDVDDALALVEAAVATTPALDPDRVGVLGLSRGGGVALLMGVREPDIDRIVTFFGPTDFFDGYVRELVEEALRGRARNLPGLRVLDERFIQPLRRGELSIADVRPELVRRSPVLYADRLPPLQVHHGTADGVVYVSQAESLIAAMQALGRGPPEFEAFLYEGAGHSFLEMPESLPRARSFLLELLAPG